MIDLYKELNDNAKEYLLSIINNKKIDKDILKRCINEINILYDKGLLFIIEYLYKYRINNKNISYHFRGMANNLLLLYVLGISRVDPIKYNLPYELFTDRTMSIDFINGSYLDFINYLENESILFRIIKGSFKKEEIEEINQIEDNHYLIIPKYYQPLDLTFRLNEFSQFETIEDYRLFKNRYLSVRLDDKIPIFSNEIDIKNCFQYEFEKNIAKLLKPENIFDYAKIISLGHGANIWFNNQDELFKQNKVNIKSIIATREDIYEYLLEHSLDIDTILDVIKCLRTNKNGLDNRYIDIMREHKCDETFIEIISKISFIFGRGQAISECLYALDKDNYYSEGEKDD